MKKYLLLSLVLIVVASCSLQFEKRRYRAGYYFSSTKKKDEVAAQQKTAEVKPGMGAHTPGKNPANEPTENARVSGDTFRSQSKIKTEKIARYQGRAIKAGDIRRCDGKRTVHQPGPDKKSSSLSSVNTSTKKDSNNNVFAYLLGGLMLAGTVGCVAGFRKQGMAIGKWARKNKVKTIIGLVITQNLIGFAGIFFGEILNDMGYHFSGTTQYVFSGTLLLGYAAIIFLGKNKQITSAKELARKKTGYFIAGVSFFLAAAAVGNSPAENGRQYSQTTYLAEKIVKQKSISEKKEALKSIHTQFNKKTKDKQELEAWRILACIGLVLAAIVLIGVTAIGACAVFCVFALADAGGGLVALGVLLALGVLALGIWGIVKVIQAAGRVVNPPPKHEMEIITPK